MKFIAYLKGEKGGVDFWGVLFLLLLSYLFFSGAWQNLYWIFIPRQPVLLEMDWDGSVMTGLYVYPDPSDRDTVGDSYMVTLSRDYDHYVSWSDGARVMQITTWYANIQDAKSAWQNPQEEINRQSRYTVEPFLSSDMEVASLLDHSYAMPLPPDVPISSSLLCYNYAVFYANDSSACIYFGYYEHWFTQIWFSKGKNFNDEVMFDLIKKAARIIRAAPAPRKWIIPTGY